MLCMPSIELGGGVREKTLHPMPRCKQRMAPPLHALNNRTKLDITEDYGNRAMTEFYKNRMNC